MSEEKRPVEMRSWLYAVVQGDLIHIHTASSRENRTKFLYVTSIPGIGEDTPDAIIDMIWEKTGVAEGCRIVRFSYMDGKDS